jgi:hypothetical protein
MAGAYYVTATVSGCTSSAGSTTVTVNSGGGGAPTLVQNTAVAGASKATTLGVTLGSTPTNGNTLIAVITAAGQYQTTGQVTGISETGATWTKAVAQGSKGQCDTEIWYANNVSGASTSITITQSASGYMSAVVAEYSGLATSSVLDKTASNSNSGSSTGDTGTTATTTQAAELWIGGIGYSSYSSTQLSSPTNGFSVVNWANGSANWSLGEVSTNLLGYSATATGTANSGGAIGSTSAWNGVVATFVAQSCGSTPATPTAGNNGPVNVGSTLSLTASTETGTYSWTGPNNFTSSAQNPTVSTSATTAMAGTYYVTVTSSGGCTSAAGSTTVTVNSSIPPGAAALGYTKLVVDNQPATSQISPYPTYNGNYDWFSGLWFDQENNSYYSESNGVLAMTLGGTLSGTPLDFSTGALPVLPGANGFYVEFVYWLSDNGSDHWPAVWLEAVEHGNGTDYYSGDPSGYERWLELDVQEGGFGPGLTGTSHSWTGIYPNYSNTQNSNNVDSTSVDQSQQHAWGASYNPSNSTVAWWVDGVQQMSAGSPSVPAIAAQQHFFLVINAASHGANTPYTMYIKSVKVYVPQSSPLPAVP